jgi:hypothetical protein
LADQAQLAAWVALTALATCLPLTGCAVLAVAGTDGLASRAFQSDARSVSGLASPPPSATAAQATTADLVAALLQTAVVELNPLVAADGIVVVLK